MKKIIVLLLAVVTVFAVAPFQNVSAIDISNLEDGTVIELDTDKPYERKGIVVDNGIVHNLYVNYKDNYMTIDNEVIEFEITELEIPLTRATIDYSSARNIQMKIPWKGSVILLASAIGFAVGGVNGSGIAGTIAGALTADAENLWVTYTQYDSKESYYSSYANVYYKKSINKNINFYETSVKASNKVYGPIQGSWFDPVRPA